MIFLIMINQYSETALGCCQVLDKNSEDYKRYCGGQSIDCGKDPDINFIGIEKYPSVLAAAINKIKQKEKKVTNLRLIRYDAIELEKVFSENEVDKIFLNFSD